jgi:hypothetical protein
MHILTLVCCTAVILPVSGLNALANPLTNPVEESPQEPSVSLTKQRTTKSIGSSPIVAQTENSWTEPVDSGEVKKVKSQLQDIRSRNFTPSRGVPSLTIANPYGFGADRGFYSSLSYQTDTRFGNESDGDATMGFGTGFGDAKKAVGAELSYTMASFGNNRDFGTGGFNAKLHRQIGEGWGVAAGWNSFLSIGDENDLDDSLYLVTTKIFKTREDLNSPFSRIAGTVGVGNGQFRTQDALENGDDGFNVFGGLAFRVAQPVSFLTEWTGQDLALGLSVSPFRTVPLTVNLGVRDLTGAGDGARFVAGIGTGF